MKLTVLVIIGSFGVADMATAGPNTFDIQREEFTTAAIYRGQHRRGAREVTGGCPVASRRPVKSQTIMVCRRGGHRMLALNPIVA